MELIEPLERIIELMHNQEFNTFEVHYDHHKWK